MGTHMAKETRPGPVCATEDIVRDMIVPLKASQPWSKRRPSGEPEPVRLACLPSMASRAWYPRIASAFIT